MAWNNGNNNNQGKLFNIYPLREQVPPGKSGSQLIGTAVIKIDMLMRDLQEVFQQAQAQGEDAVSLRLMTATKGKAAGGFWLAVGPPKRRDGTQQSQARPQWGQPQQPQQPQGPQGSPQTGWAPSLMAPPAAPTYPTQPLPEGSGWSNGR